MSGAAVMPKVNLDKIPQELKDLPRWVVWRWENRNGKPTKPPYRPDGKGLASSTDPETWGTFHAAFQACRTGEYDGIGLVLSPADRLVGIDLDHCHNLETGEIDQWAQEYARTLNSYTERSVSGTGLHVLVFGSVPEGGNKKRIQGAQSEAAVEMYSHGRYLTMTGAHLEGTPTTVQERDPELKALHAEIFPPVLPPMRVQHNAQPLDMDDAELVTRAKAATNGAHFSRLWEGDTSAHGGDDSAADLALCSLLAFWTGRDAGRIDRLFKMSGLYRQKWDRSDYRQRTIETAIVGCTEVYTPARALLSNGHSSRAIPTAPMPLAGPDLTAPAFPPSEAGNAELFAHLYGDRVRHDHSRKRDLLWANHWWEEDPNGELVRMALDTARLRKKLAGEIQDPDASKKAFIWAVGSESRARLANTIEIARNLHPIADDGEGWDADPFLLGAGNGVVDLRNGQLRPGLQSDRITMHTSVPYEPEAKCLIWGATLERILPDVQVRGFFKRLAGYGITGSVREQCLPFLFGGGRNGKSTALKAILDTIGNYGRQAAPDLLTYSKESRHPTEIADLYGARFVASVEVEEGKRLAEVLLKQMTGGDRLKGRKMKQDFFEFAPTHKVFLAANHKPIIKGTDTAIWRRILLIPFTVTIPEEEVDRDLPDKLHAERGGILRWLVEGCLEWQRDGLKPPKAVRAATEAYRSEMDTLAAFLADCCTVASNTKGGATALYAAYKGWCEANGERYDQQRVFASGLAERGFESRRSGPRGAVEWHGLGLRDDPQSPLPTEPTEPLDRNWGIDRELISSRGDIPQNASNGSVGSVDIPGVGGNGDAMVYHDGDCPALDGGECNCESLEVA